MDEMNDIYVVQKLLDSVRDAYSTQSLKLLNVLDKYTRLEGDVIRLLIEAEELLDTADAALKLGKSVVVDQRISAVRDDMRKMCDRLLSSSAL